MQLRFKSGLTGAEYVTRKGWKLASLPCCPIHEPGANCGFARHGTYSRKTPPGTEIARWRCPTGHCTFSLLPDHLAARFPGMLCDIEEVLASVEQARSLETEAQRLRSLDISLPSAVRWVRRRVSPARQLFKRVIELFPQRLAGCALRLASLRKRLGCDCVLVKLREVAEDHLAELVPPLGFKPPPYARAERKSRFHQHTGLDPPPQPA